MNDFGPKPNAVMRLPIVYLTFFAFAISSTALSAADIASNISRRAHEIFTAKSARELADAATRGDTAKMEILISQGVSVDTSGLYGITPAWWAIRNMNATSFEWLLSHGASPNPDISTITIMEMAAGYERPDFLKIALRFSPDINLVGKFTGKSPLHTAIIYGRTDNLRRLIEAGADLNQEEGEFPLVTASSSGRYDYVYMMLEAGADPHLTAQSNKVSLKRMMEARLINPDGEAYVWRERVSRWLQARGIPVKRPEGERARTKPLPDDLK